MGRLKKSDIIITVSIILFMLIIYWLLTLFVNIEKKYQAKINIIQQDKIKAEAKANKKSDIELLEFWAKENASSAKQRLEDIAWYKLEITKLQWLYETELLTQRCYEAQIDRKINWLEYNIEYCKDETNLDQYRTKKY